MSKLLFEFFYMRKNGNRGRKWEKRKRRAIAETCREREEIVRRAETEPEKRDKKVNVELRLGKEK